MLVFMLSVSSPLSSCPIRGPPRFSTGGGAEANFEGESLGSRQILPVADSSRGVYCGRELNERKINEGRTGK